MDLDFKGDATPKAEKLLSSDFAFDYRLGAAPCQRID